MVPSAHTQEVLNKCLLAEERGTSVSSIPGRLLPWDWEVFFLLCWQQNKIKINNITHTQCRCGPVIWKTLCTSYIIDPSCYPVTSWIGTSIWLVWKWEPREGVMDEYLCSVQHSRWSLNPNVMVFGDGAFGVIRPRGQNWPQASFCHVGRQQEVSSMKPGQQPAPEADRADNQITDFPRSELCEGNSIFVSYRSLCYFLIAVWSDYDNYLSLAKLIFTEWTNDLKEFLQRTWTEDDADSGRTSDQ